ncbi:hypothetical protein KKE06_02245 [Candidatus Micrarchaeota archaeon]|nr:hypothetical protein [Candidatus Micrarchaeota archaeon]MBU1930818.1 hypothetical protein [Candidatus Micrarchaeota archaeon]
MTRSKSLRDPKIEKPEDSEWLKWYKGLSQKDHEKYLAKLGLDASDQEELSEIKKELKKAKIMEEE